MKGKRFFLVLSLLLAGLFFTTATGRAQSFEALIGGSCSFASKRNIQAELSPLILPPAGIIFRKAVFGRAGLRTGLLYQQKGLSSEVSTRIDSTQSTISVAEKTTCHYVSVPLQLLLAFPAADGPKWSLALGMSYCFLVYASASGTIRTYQNTHLSQEVTYDQPRYIGFAPSRNGSRRNDRSELNGFVPSLRVDVGYAPYLRISLGCFYEYQLGDISSNTGNTKVNLHSIGLTAGYSLSE